MVGRMAKMTTLYLGVPPLVVTALPLLLASPSFPAPSWLASVGSCLYTRPTRAPQTSPAPGGSVADPALNSPALPGAPRSACKAPTRHRLLPPLGRRRPHRPRTARQSAAARVSRHACAPGAPSPRSVSQVTEPLYRSLPILNVVPSRSPRRDHKYCTGRLGYQKSPIPNSRKPATAEGATTARSFQRPTDWPAKKGGARHSGPDRGAGLLAPICNASRVTADISSTPWEMRIQCVLDTRDS